jgi:RNA polymerase sigma-70 factor (ECF subfamily)
LVDKPESYRTFEAAAAFKTARRSRRTRHNMGEMDRDTLQRLHDRARAGRWKVPPDVLLNALERSAEKTFAGRSPTAADLDRYYDSLHLEDLALACACAMGREDAWDHFVREFRPAMYRSADAIDASGAAREIAEALYAELFGLREKDGIRQSVFRYFHGRSSLATWLRSLIAQRYVDRFREHARLDPLPEESSAAPMRSAAPEPDPDRSRYVAALRATLAAAIAALAPRERLRLACYYAQEMTLAQIAAMTRESEATVSRQLAKTRKGLRVDVEARLAADYGFGRREIDECFASVVNDAGHLDVEEWLGSGAQSTGASGAERKKVHLDRSINEEAS